MRLAVRIKSTVRLASAVRIGCRVRVRVRVRGQHASPALGSVQSRKPSFIHVTKAQP